jgi:predicted dehydrogenase
MSTKSSRIDRTNRTSRREFLKGTAAAAGVGLWGYWVGGRGTWAAAATGPTTSPNERVNLGIIGVGGRAKQNLEEENRAVTGQNIVALCDVDGHRLADVADEFPNAEQYRDFRRLLDRKDIDAVVISTADHTHAAAALMALESGRHVYCEKPLTHTVDEARRVTEAARKHRRVTQMGTQIHAGSNYRRVVELVQGGAIGKVAEVHVFQSSKWSGAELPTESPPVPEYLDYDLWLGPVPHRPYHAAYHPASWRGYWAFGNGTLGDMGCHYIDLPFWALGLTHPTKVAAEGPPVHEYACPPWLIVRYEFPARGDQPPVKLTWYDAGKKPAAYDEWDLPRNREGKGPPSGVVFVGERGMLFADYNQRKLMPERAFADYTAPPPTIPESIGHHREWLEAIRRNDPSATTCRFDYSGPLTEAVLLGTVAYRTGKTLEWDAKHLKVTNVPEAERFLRKAYRQGWGL